MNDKAWCCKYLRHFSFLNIFLFPGGRGGGGVEPNHTVYLVPTFTDGRGGGLGAISVAIKKTWSSIINYCEKIHQKLYT
ncbi:MAG: hypothetical protein ACK55Z_11795, partial [bacterium]